MHPGPDADILCDPQATPPSRGADGLTVASPPAEMPDFRKIENSMSGASLRIGLIGAGENTRRRHIPGLQALPGVELATVANRTAESSGRVAEEFGIARVSPDWQSVIADPAIDAVVIGTWPNMHAEITCAALAAGKHVLCESRMARNVGEARQMQAAAASHSDRVAMLVPSPFGLECGPEVRSILGDHGLGELREVVVIGADDQFLDFTKFLHWRQDAEISGFNALTLGILHETLLRWSPQPSRVLAQTQLFEPTRANPNGAGTSRVTVPDSLQIMTQYANGGRGLYHFSGVSIHGPGKQIHLYGSRGTIKVLFGERERLFFGRRPDAELREIAIPPERLGQWRVEAEFVGAIRGEEKVQLTSFETGVRYMEFVEAVARSAAENVAVSLPLAP